MGKNHISTEEVTSGFHYPKLHTRKFSKRLGFLAGSLDTVYSYQLEKGLTDEEAVKYWWDLLKVARISFDRTLDIYKFYKRKYEKTQEESVSCVLEDE